MHERHREREREKAKFQKRREKEKERCKTAEAFCSILFHHHSAAPATEERRHLGVTIPFGARKRRAESTRNRFVRTLLEQHVSDKLVALAARVGKSCAQWQRGRDGVSCACRDVARLLGVTALYKPVPPHRSLKFGSAFSWSRAPTRCLLPSDCSSDDRTRHLSNNDSSWTDVPSPFRKSRTLARCREVRRSCCRGSSNVGHSAQRRQAPRFEALSRYIVGGIGGAPGSQLVPHLAALDHPPRRARRWRR